MIANTNSTIRKYDGEERKGYMQNGTNSSPYLDDRVMSRYVLDNCAECKDVAYFVRTNIGLTVRCSLCGQEDGPFRDRADAMCKWNIEQRKKCGKIVAGV